MKASRENRTEKRTLFPGRICPVLLLGTIPLEEYLRGTHLYNGSLNRSSSSIAGKIVSKGVKSYDSPGAFQFWRGG